jgi:hypothetical protein
MARLKQGKTGSEHSPFCFPQLTLAYHFGYEIVRKWVDFPEIAPFLPDSAEDVMHKFLNII